MTAYEFGAELLRTGDLDPVYVVLHHAGLDRSTLQRWLLAYWCFYHVGTASWIADVSKASYWSRMARAAGSKEYPRSSERRHFRGRQAAASVQYLRGRRLEGLFGDLAEADGTAAGVMGAVRGWRGFGPWISFKVADMVERLGLAPVAFALDDALYDSPRKAAELLLHHEGNPGDRPDDVGAWAVDRVLGHRLLKGFTAPPRHERPLNVQEAETILCKWGSYLKGHYHVGEDVAAVRTGLGRFPGCKTAARLLAAGAEGGLW